MILTLNEVKAHLRLDDDTEDAVLTGFIKQAQASAESFCRVSFEEDGADVPEPVRLACLLFVAFYFENRDVPDKTLYETMMTAFESLLYPYRDPEQLF